MPQIWETESPHFMVENYITHLRKNPKLSIDEKEADLIRKRAAFWSDKPKYRQEFKSFAAFDSYLRWSGQGRIKAFAGTNLGDDL